MFFTALEATPHIIQASRLIVNELSTKISGLLIEISIPWNWYNEDEDYIAHCHNRWRIHRGWNFIERRYIFLCHPPREFKRQKLIILGYMNMLDPAIESAFSMSTIVAQQLNDLTQLDLRVSRFAGYIFGDHVDDFDLSKLRGVY